MKNLNEEVFYYIERRICFGGDGDSAGTAQQRMIK